MRMRQDLHLAGYDLKYAQAHYFGTILAIPVPV